MRLHHFCLLLSTLALPAAATSIEGTVREAGTRRPVPGAAVFRVGDGGTADEVVSDDTGAFVLALPDGMNVKGAGEIGVVVEVDTDGYDRLVERVVLRRDRDTTVVDLYLVPNVVGETSVRERRSKEAVARGAHRIADREATELPGTYSDPAKAIENFPGMGRVLLSQGSLFIRGAAPNESAVFVDDYEIPDLYHYTGSTSVINYPFVESVELVPGAFSARYGRSIGGIVTLKTKKLPTDDVHGLAKLDVIDGGAYVGVPLSDTVVIGASARRSYLDVFRRVQLAAIGSGDGIVQVPTYWDYQLKLDADVAPGHEFTVFLFGSGDREDNIADGNGAVAPSFRQSESDFHRLSLRYSHGLGSGMNHTLTVVGGYERATLNEQYGLRFKDRQSLDLQLRDELVWRTTTLGGRPTKIILGIDATARNDGWTYGGLLVADDAGTFPSADADGSVRDRRRETGTARGTAALYLEATIEPVDGVTIVPGVRLDGMLLEVPADVGGVKPFLNIEPRLAGTWQLVSDDDGFGTLARMALAQTSRPPDAEEVAIMRDLGVGLTPQRALQVQGGFEQGLGTGLVLSSTLYAVWRDGLNTRAPLFPTPVRTGTLPLTTGTTGKSAGAEFLLRFAAKSGAFAWLTYSIARHERSDDARSSSSVAKDYAYLQPFDTTHLLGVMGQLPLAFGFRAGARYRVATGMPDTPVIGSVFASDTGLYTPIFAPTSSNRFPPFHALDVRVDWSTTLSWCQLTVYADLVNVFNLRAQEGTLYNFDYTQSTPRLGLPTIPAVGVKATF
ncbi:MAG TPA: TonB-dependent receptor [Myxococcota bacterium]